MKCESIMSFYKVISVCLQEFYLGEEQGGLTDYYCLLADYARILLLIRDDSW